ncbi:MULTISPECIES: sulfur carrier protein ThiS [unclassified Neorhizobium]|uniref:sulfur carrier protein ThiS n=1 Tax=unclassified Neorhizobium TaxID=2629175 RepID=UPI001FF43A5B|nr:MULTISPECIES: sulfur carrier protein ThiS [unclassified Neorhizobium]MCJ9670326.1 sulfur carrier protein ThiS [Neorhizobium sp. SHOUNA12B]MCJ9746581.1 sulfur carrier protein ThiS [Neorhizobium sp. SHOUNA12A]
MTLIINGETQVCAVVTLAELLHILEYDGDWLATAVNGALVHREDRSDQRLEEGDRIEILAPMQGG